LLPGVSDSQKVALMAAAHTVFPEMAKPVFAKKSAPG